MADVTPALSPPDLFRRYVSRSAEAARRRIDPDAPVMADDVRERALHTLGFAMQEETACLGVPCITMRENTERPVTLEVGASRLVGNDPARVAAAFADVVSGRWGEIGKIPLWDGRASERVADAISELVLRKGLGGAPHRRTGSCR